MYSEEHKKYLKKERINKRIVLFFKLFLIISFLVLWESLARLEIINPFLTSSPFEIINTITELYKQNNLFMHICTTFYETMICFLLSSIIALLIASILWLNDTLYKIIDPYLTILNSLPKVSLGPLIIIWIGANTNSIILMAILITIFTEILNIYSAFINTDKQKILLLKTFGATKMQIFTKLVLRGNIKSLISTLKISISLSLIGIIMGELLVSKKGLGYLITYGSQVFNLNLVIASIFILGIMSYFMYLSIDLLEIKINK